MTDRWVFNHDSPEVRHICERDPVFGRLVELVGDVEVQFRSQDIFEALVRSIVGQQLSNKAADAIWARLREVCQGVGNARGKATDVVVTPDRLSSLDDEALRAAGLSRPKISYIRDLCLKVQNGEIDPDGVRHLSDRDLISSLTKVKGIGEWSCQMLMIFSLGRLDVFAPADLALRRAITWLYELKEPLRDSDLLRMSERWRPYRTVASLYLWESANLKSR